VEPEATFLVAFSAEVVVDTDDTDGHFDCLSLSRSILPIGSSTKDTCYAYDDGHRLVVRD
jgi:hypothetical protein